MATNSLKDSRVGTKQRVIAKIIKIAKFDDIERTMRPAMLPVERASKYCHMKIPRYITVRPPQKI